MNRIKNLRNLKKIIYFLEILISLILIAGIIVSIPDLIKYFISIIYSSKATSYDFVQEFLSHVLLLVIGLEFVLMLIAHSDSSVIFLILMVIARKMLIYANTSTDLLIGVIALFFLFVIKKFLITNKVSHDSGVFSVDSRIMLINKELNYDIKDVGFDTLGELVEYLLSEKSMKPMLGSLVDDFDYIYKIEKVSNGKIEEIRVIKK